MLPKISRYLLIVFTIITLAYALPAIYQTLFDTRINAPFVTYSELNKDYFVMRNIDGKPAFVDTKKKVYTQQEYMNATPVFNYHYHLSRGTLPDSIDGIKLDPRMLQHESAWQMISPDVLYAPAYRLYPLFESQPEFGLKLPSDLFRINKRIEFIDTKTNDINEEKSRLFSTSFEKEGFQYPAKLTAGIPTVMKRKDDGWFLTDSRDNLYHLKMVKSEPYFKKISKPADLKIKHIICNDFESEEFYALLITDSNRLYTLNTQDYSFSRLPVEDYKPESQVLMLAANLFNKSVTLQGEQGVHVYTMNRQYQKINEYHEALPDKSAMTAGKISSFMFPFQIRVDSLFSGFIDFDMDKSSGYSWIILHVLLLLVTLWIFKRQNARMPARIADLLFVALTGVFGFIAVHVFRDKEY